MWDDVDCISTPFVPESMGYPWHRGGYDAEVLEILMKADGELLKEFKMVCSNMLVVDSKLIQEALLEFSIIPHQFRSVPTSPDCAQGKRQKLFGSLGNTINSNSLADYRLSHCLLQYTC